VVEQPEEVVARLLVHAERLEEAALDHLCEE
jgi:hypothetical protein